MNDEVTSIFRRCSRCDTIIEMVRPDEDSPGFSDWDVLRKNLSVDVAHPQGQCPAEVEARALAVMGQHNYLITLTLERDGVVEAEVKSGVVSAMTFKDATPLLTDQLNAQWVRLARLGNLIDTPNDSE